MLGRRPLSFGTVIGTALLLLLFQHIDEALTEDYSYGSEPSNPENNIYGSETTEQDNNCQNNELPGSITPDVYGNMQMQALRRKLWRILSSPMNDNIIVPNYEALSDGKILYDMASQSGGHVRDWWHPNFKRNIASILKSKLIPPMLKKSIATLAKNGQLPVSHLPEDEIVDQDEVKRNVASLARARGVHEWIKRSLQALARNSHFPDKAQNEDMGNYFEYNADQLPIQHYYYAMDKKNIDPLALKYLYGNNGLENKRNIQYVMKNGGVKDNGGKRNIASLIKNHNMPETVREEQRNNEKRNIGAIARDWALPNHSTGWNKNSEEKRNVAALLRQDSYSHSTGADIYPTPDVEEDGQYDNKRNIGSIKAGKRGVKRSLPAAPANSGRHKRQADEYFTENAEDYNPVLYKSNSNDYDELAKAFATDYFYNQKRFLGNIPLSRMTELGKISLMGQPHMSNATPTSPTYRRKQYLLSRTLPVETEEK